MKILHLIYIVGIAAVEKYLMNLLPGLKQHGIDCELLCICPSDLLKEKVIKYCDEMSKKGVKTTIFYGNRILFLKNAKKIKQYLKQSKISIIHSHLINADLLAVLTKVLFNKKLFLISGKHGYDERFLIKYPGYNVPQKIDRNLYYFVTKFILSKINVNVAISKAMANLYYKIKLIPYVSHHIYHGINHLNFFNNENGDNIKKSELQLVIVGRLEKMKGHKYLLKAMPAVINKFPDVKLMIIGEGSEKDNLVQQAFELNISSQIIFMGYQINPYKYITASDIIILPSLFEPFGLVYIEAFALQKPVIAFDVEATNEIIENNETGLLVPRCDSKALANQIIFLLSNPRQAQRLAVNAYNKYCTYFNSERMITETVQWYNSLHISGD